MGLKDLKQNKKWKWALIIGIPVVLILILLGVAALSLNTILKPIIKKNLETLVVNGSDSLYKFSLKDYSVGSNGSTVELNDFKLEVDSTRYLKLKKANLLPKLILSINLKYAKLSGLSAYNLIQQHDIEVRKILMSGAVIFIQQQLNDSIKAEPRKTLYELIKNDIQSIKINQIVLKDADITFRTQLQKTHLKDSWRFEKTHFQIDDIYVDSTSHNDTTRILYASNLKFQTDKLKMNSGDGNHEFSLSSTNFDFKKRILTLNSLRFYPSISQSEFNQKMGHEANRITITIPVIEVQNFNASELFVGNNLIAQTINIQNPKILIHKDRTAGPDFVNKMYKFPHQLLMMAKLRVNIDSIFIKNGTFTYSEKNANTGKVSFFNFSRVNGPIDNITNDASKIPKNRWCKAKINANFLGSNPVNTVFRFDLASKNGRFITDASLGSLSTQNINPILRSYANSEAESFTLDKLVYHVEGDDRKAVGNLRFLYHNLKLSVLKNDSGEMKKRRIVSFAANLLLKNENLVGIEERKAINVQLIRLPYKNYFGIICRTLINCVAEVVIDKDKKKLAKMAKKRKKG